MKKGSKTVIITVGIMCFILVSLMFIQFNTIQKVNVANLQSMRETELRSELASWNTKYQDLNAQYQDILTKKQQYSQSIGEDAKTMQLLQQELGNSNTILGLTDVEGKGVVVTLTDNDQVKIEAYDLIELINELRLSGAEAISINDERIVYNSYVADINYSFIMVDGNRLTSPYVVKAIGDQTYLESGLTAKQYGYLDTVINGYGKTANIARQDDIKIKKFTGTLNSDQISTQ
ncbi:MAG: DUF881 domain-containing protein [Oscillospiraceae bacterium]|nr:DUF881 domain-containing protein [Oscillospiraceae bacterium]